MDIGLAEVGGHAGESFEDCRQAGAASERHYTRAERSNLGTIYGRKSRSRQANRFGRGHWKRHPRSPKRNRYASASAMIKTLCGFKLWKVSPVVQQSLPVKCFVEVSNLCARCAVLTHWTFRAVDRPPPQRYKVALFLELTRLKSMEVTKLVGSSPVVQALQEEIYYASRCDAKVLITGESGAGKEIVARLIHEGSPRRRAQLITVNCAALTETLLETELFGHVRGSFTGAYRDRSGVFELANRGTVFMDEIGETTPRMQGLLLRFMETGEIQRVGSDQVQSARQRAGHRRHQSRCWSTSVAAKTFREDLYYRLNVIQLQRAAAARAPRRHPGAAAPLPRACSRVNIRRRRR